MVTESPNKKSINGKSPVFGVLQLSGGNDFLSTVVPYNDPYYFEFRNTVGIPEEKSLQNGNGFGMHPSMGPK